MEWQPVGQGSGGFALEEFRRAARLAERPEKPQRIKKLRRKRRRFPENVAEAVTRRSRGGPMSRGELYAYFKRTGRLGIFWSLYPQG
jgi:hypothetical protein